MPLHVSSAEIKGPDSQMQEEEVPMEAWLTLFREVKEGFLEEVAGTEA